MTLRVPSSAAAPPHGRSIGGNTCGRAWDSAEITADLCGPVGLCTVCDRFGHNGIHHFVQPFEHTAAEEIHSLEAERAQKDPSLRGVSATVGIEDDRLGLSESRCGQLAQCDTLCARKMIALVRCAVADVDYSEVGASFLDPFGKLERSHVIVFTLDNSCELLDVDARVRLAARRSGNDCEGAESKTNGGENAVNSPRALSITHCDSSDSRSTRHHENRRPRERLFPARLARRRHRAAPEE